ncbi:unnamed protein product [Polarella glacialis]|uniref:RNA polymerase II-associated protein 1 C-terminal domain-containing protein n=1 Tax=Polarella glacialis TaxID=89957 RepID=A0A813GDL8_POLGL|nr:unnamed protein product [Polarella glacialis]CAE8684728.1 unnamed protein product [Polarella glacialis]
MESSTMHQSRRPKLRRGAEENEDDNENFEALLREQAAFGSGRGGSPAATAFRAPPRRPPAESEGTSGAAGASEDGPQESVGKPRQASLFKQLRQGLAAGAGAATLAGRPFGAPAAAPHPEISALPELEDDECEEVSTCLAELVAERAPPRVHEGEGDVRAGDKPFSCPAPSGFPVATHRAFDGKSLGRSFRSGLGEKTGDLEDEEEPDDEEGSMDLSNRKALQKASPEEVREWQQELLERLGSATCDFLKRRGEEKMRLRAKAAPAATTDEQDGPATPATSSTSAAGPEAAAQKEPRVVRMELNLQSQGADASDPQVTSSGEGSGSRPAFMDHAEALQTFAGGCLDRSEMQKLQWTTPSGKPDLDLVASDESLPPEPAGKVMQLLRFDFEGRVCLRVDSGEEEGENSEGDTEEPSVSEGLHHHGVESSQAGYTFAELLLLSRSASAPQRALALSTLACILQRARVPASKEVLAADPALCMAGNLKVVYCLDELDGQPVLPSTMPQQMRGGFGMGSAVFFWHALARGDIPKHLAEALCDHVLLVQIAALRGVAALLDGSSGELDDDNILHVSSRTRSSSSSASASASRLTAGGGVLNHAWDVARQLVWPSAPPNCNFPLARRARVTVLTSEGQGGQGGGAAAWPQLLRRRLLGAKEEPEVTAADVLEPLLPPPPASGLDELDGALPKLVAGVVFSCVPAALAGSDPALLRLAARALSATCTWSSHLCLQVLESSSNHRRDWLRAAAGSVGAGPGAGTTGKAGQPAEWQMLQADVLCFIRRSCEVSGKAAAAWWLGLEHTSRGTQEATKEADEWTVVAVVRRALLNVVAAKELTGSKSTGVAQGGENTAECSSLQVACASEAVKIWLAWLRAGAGCDKVESFMTSIGTYFHRLALAGESLDSELMDQHWLLASLLLQLISELSPAVPSKQAEEALSLLPASSREGVANAALSTAANAAGPLASALSNGAGADASAPRQLCLAALADWLASAFASLGASVKNQALLPAARTLLVAQVRAQLPEASVAEEEAPWPLGSAAECRSQHLARLGALRALCRLAGRVRGPLAVELDLLAWLQRVRKAAAKALEHLSPLNVNGASSEAMVGTVQQDAWPALLSAACQALAPSAVPAKLGESADKTLEEKVHDVTPAHEELPLSPPLLASALALCACWPTARELLGTAGLHFGVDGEDAVVRAAFRPEAPWTPVTADAESRAARATGRVPAPTRSLSAPEALGPPALAFAAAPFWALLASPPSGAVHSLLEALGSSAAEGLARAAPPWLPFLAFVSVLCTPMDGKSSCGERCWAWKNDKLRASLRRYAVLHLNQDPALWFIADADWLREALRGLCNRLALTFTEESFGDELLASALWAFAASPMPLECRSICWGSQDPGVLTLLSRTLPLREEDGSAQLASRELLIWPLSSYLDAAEDLEVVKQAAATLGVEAKRMVEKDASGNYTFCATSRPSSWPALLAAQQLARCRDSEFELNAME